MKIKKEAKKVIKGIKQFGIGMAFTFLGLSSIMDMRKIVTEQKGIIEKQVKVIDNLKEERQKDINNLKEKEQGIGDILERVEDLELENLDEKLVEIKNQVDKFNFDEKNYEELKVILSKIKRLYDIKENVDSTKKELIDETITSCEDKIFDEIREKIPIKNDKKAKTIFSLLALDNLVLDARIKVVNGTDYVTYKNGVFYEIKKVDKDRYQINVYNINKAREEYVDCLLSGKEMEEVWNWIRMLIPIITENGKVQMIVAAALQYPEMQEFVANDSTLALLPYDWWHQFIDTPAITTFRTTGSYNYQLFSVDFLHHIVTKEKVDEYILECLALNNCSRGEFFAMYIDAHKEIIKSRIVKRTAKTRYLAFLSMFLNDPSLSLNNMMILVELDIHINDFFHEEFYESLSKAFLSGKNDYKVIPSWRILSFFISSSNKADKEIAARYLQRIFLDINENSENDKFKKKVAEMYILHIHDNPEINCWYIKYLMKPSSTISEEFVHSTLQKAFFADIDSLKLFPDLIATCEGDHDDYHKIIIRLVINSLKYFCNRIQSLCRDQRESVLKTMDILCSSDNNFWAFPLREEAKMNLLMSISQKPTENEIIIHCRNIISGTL